MTNVTIENQIGQTFTFQDGDVDDVTSRTTSTPDADAMPGSFPGDAIIFDLNGSLKQITVTGKLKDSTGSNRVTGTGAPTVQTILQQKMWLETLHTGDQLPVKFTSNYELYTFKGTFNSTNLTTFLGGSATYDTYVVAISINFKEVAGTPNVLDYSLQLTVGLAP